jgi:hypothetical protein
MADNAFIPFFEQTPKPSDKDTFSAMAPAAPAPASKHGGVSHPHNEPHRPVIKLQKEGDKIRSIRIECVCGQVIELDCVY